ncbi:MAG: DNA primase [Candidatus Levybacteria bacterium]|nr:DNA primase [Candidatus Levybacteria bacterium]
MDDVAKIRSKIDIVSLISEYIPLKKMGRNFKANCPFHSEKTPSFVVSPERQIWHCFGGCSKGGDCYTFLMEYENLEFPEALRILAKKAGIEIEKYSGFKSGVSSKKENIYKLNRLAAQFYHYILISHNAGKKAEKYLLEKRGIKKEVIDTFMLGFAPGSGRSLVSYLIDKKGYKKEDLIDAGLAGYRNGRLFDFFINRLMFPLFDHRDNIVGFAGRIIDSSAGSVSKYVNTRETLAYHKGDVFFGLNIAKDKIKKEDKVIIMEGEFDVISSFQAGITNVVAVKGTALTENQVNLISRFTQKVALCFDEDNAGQDAIKRSLSVLEKKGITTTIIVSNGKDPDESIKEDEYLFKKAVKNDQNIYEFLLSKVLLNFDKKTATGKKKIGDEMLPVISQIENEIVKEHFLKKLSTELDTTYETLRRQIEKFNKKEADALVSISSRDKKPRKEILEEYLLSLIVQNENPKVVLETIKNIISDSMFEIPSTRKIFNCLLSYFENNDLFESKKFLELIPEELIPAFDIFFLKLLPKFIESEKYKEEVIKVANDLKTLFLKSKIREISSKIKSKEGPDQTDDLKALQEEFNSITSLLQKS